MDVVTRDGSDSYTAFAIAQAMEDQGWSVFSVTFCAQTTRWHVFCRATDATPEKLVKMDRVWILGLK